LWQGLLNVNMALARKVRGGTVFRGGGLGT
jgi:hypothetical protein